MYHLKGYEVPSSMVPVRWVVHEKRGPIGHVQVAAVARVDRAFFVLPFSFVTFLLGKQKKSNQVPTLFKTGQINKLLRTLRKGF